METWKARCLALAQELDAYEAAWKSTEKRLIKMLARLLCALEEEFPALEQPFGQLREVVRRGLLDEAALGQLEELTDLIFRGSEQVRRERALKAQELNRQLLRFLEVFETPPALAELKPTESLPAKGLEEAVDGTVRLLVEIDLRMRQERTEIEGFLAQLAEKLRFLESLGQDVGRALQGHGDHWDQSVAQLDCLRVRALEETDLERLKLTIAERLEVLQALYEKEAARNAEMADRMKVLTCRLQELEQESEELRQRLKAAYQEARYDPVTGLPNRKAVEERLSVEFSRWQRFHEPLSLLIWDIDHFKSINDRFGHQAGDKTLRIVGQTLRAGIREVDFVGRYGGEEFVMLLPGTHLEGACKVAEKLRVAVKSCGVNSRGKPVLITISCGLSCARPGDTQESLFERADKALYQAKQAGRDRVVAS
jgi:diguanylate cyclase